MKSDKMYVAVFKNHPLGANRYVKDFKRNLASYNAPWWATASEDQRKKHFEWSLNHKQYHYSTLDINNADLWQGNSKEDEEDRDILEKYAPVEYIEVEFNVWSK